MEKKLDESKKPVRCIPANPSAGITRIRFQGCNLSPHNKGAPRRKYIKKCIYSP